MMKLTIPKPCSEDYLKMSATEKGRFCDSCKKEVIDFTSLSEAQILEVFRNNNSTVCGRFKSTQLEKEYKNFDKPRWTQSSWIAAMFSTLMVLSSSNSKGGIIHNDLPGMQIDNGFKKTLDAPTLHQTDSVKIVKGVVLDEAGKGLPGASIQLKGTNIKAVSTTDGGFEIKIPVNTQLSEAELQINFIGYVPLSRTLNGYKEGYPLLLALQPAILGKIAVLAGGVVCKKPTLWSRFTGLFK